MRQLGIVKDEPNAWAGYLHAVYGSSVSFPFDLRRLTWFWWWAPGAANLTRIEAPVFRRILLGDIWVPGLRTERHLAAAGFFVNHAESHEELASTGEGADYASAQHLEVMRVSHGSGESTMSAYGPEAAGSDQTWYWHAPGSGILLSIGRSLVVRNRTELLGRLAARIAPRPLPLATKRVRVPSERGLKLCDGCSVNAEETWRDFDVLWWSSAQPPTGQGPRVCELVRHAGYDTVQLTRAFDGQRHEIIDCRRARTTAAPEPASGCPPSSSRIFLRRGSRADEPCECDEARPFLNCGRCAAPERVWRRAQPAAAAVEVHARGRHAHEGSS